MAATNNVASAPDRSVGEPPMTSRFPSCTGFHRRRFWVWSSGRSLERERRAVGVGCAGPWRRDVLVRKLGRKVRAAGSADVSRTVIVSAVASQHGFDESAKAALAMRLGTVRRGARLTILRSAALRSRARMNGVISNRSPEAATAEANCTCVVRAVSQTDARRVQVCAARSGSGSRLPIRAIASVGSFIRRAIRMLANALRVCSTERGI